MLASNPLPFFLDNLCDRGVDDYIRYSELYLAYVKFLSKLKRRIVSRKEFNNVLLQEGLESRRTSKTLKDGEYENGYFVEGIKLKDKWENEIMQVMSIMHDFSLSSAYREFKSELLHKQHNLHNFVDNGEKKPKNDENVNYDDIEEEDLSEKTT